VKIFFAQPPAAQREGGLDRAIIGWRQALMLAGQHVVPAPHVRSWPGNEPPGTILHLHGLWQRDHSVMAKKCALRGIPTVVSPHGMLEPWSLRHKWWKKWPYFIWRERSYLANATCLLATSEMEQHNIQALFPKQRIAVLPLGVDDIKKPAYAEARDLLGWEKDEWVILFLSRIHPKKGLDLLIKALAARPDLWPARVRLVIAGTGADSYRIQLHRLCAKLAGKLPHIDWIGETRGRQKWLYYQGADLFCLPSYSENFGYVILEACQAGTPVLTGIATPWEMLEKAGRGWVVTPSVAGIIGGLGKFFLRGRFSEQERNSLSHWANQSYAWDRLAPEYVSLYQSLPRPEIRVPAGQVE
jgi:glycosyltransferase involved in cell wall biosynthesis